MEELIKSFENTYDSDAAYKTVAQVGDVAVDALIDDGVLDGVPIISTLKGLYKATKNFQLYRLMKKMHKFIFVTHDTTSCEREKFIAEYAEKNKENGCEALFAVLERIDNINKVDVLANLIKAKIKGFISIENFIRLTTILERIPFSDLRDLPKYINDYYEHGSTDILLSAGVLNQTVLDANGSNKYRLNFLGAILLKYGLSYDVDVETMTTTNITQLEWGEY